MLASCGLWAKDRILCGGLAELIVNAVTDMKPGCTERERH